MYVEVFKKKKKNQLCVFGNIEKENLHTSSVSDEAPYNLLTVKVGGKDCNNFLALPASLTLKVYKYLEPLSLNLVCLKALPFLFNFLLILTVAELTSCLLINSKNSLISAISLAILYVFPSCWCLVTENRYFNNYKPQQLKTKNVL